MAKRIISILLSFCLVLSIVPFNASAAGTATVSDLAALEAALDSGATAITLTGKITVTTGDVKLTPTVPVTITTSVDDAFEVTGGTLTLGENITINSDTSILYANGGAIVIDGAKLTSTSTAYAMVFASGSSSSVTINAGSVLSSAVAALSVAGGAQATMNGGDVSTTGASSPIRVRGAGSLLTINGGTVEAKVTDSSISAAFAYDGGEIVVNGGTLTVANDSYALIAAKVSGTSGGKVTVNGGTVDGVLAHEDGASSAAITGGTITKGIGVGNGASLTVSGGDISGAITVRTSGGTIAISGGTFEQDPSSYLVNGVTVSGDSSTGYLAGVSVKDLAELQAALSSGAPAITLTGKITVTTGDVKLTPTVPVTITTSVDDAFEVTGGTLTLGENITVNSSTSILYANGGAIVIDGAELTSTTTAYAMVFASGSSSSITVNEGSVLSSAVAALSVAGGAQATMNGGDVSTTGASSPIRVRGAGSLLTINGGTVEAKVTDSSISAAFAYDGGEIVVNGGTLTVANDSYALIAAKVSGTSGGKVTVNGGTVDGVLAHEDGASSAAITGGTITKGIGVGNSASLTVSGGDISGAITVRTSGGTIAISGGTFDHDPNAYTVDGYSVIGNATDGYTVVPSTITSAKFYWDGAHGFADGIPYLLDGSLYMTFADNYTVRTGHKVVVTDADGKEIFVWDFTAPGADAARALILSFSNRGAVNSTDFAPKAGDYTITLYDSNNDVVDTRVVTVEAEARTPGITDLSYDAAKDELSFTFNGKLLGDYVFQVVDTATGGTVYDSDKDAGAATLDQYSTGHTENVGWKDRQEMQWKLNTSGNLTYVENTDGTSTITLTDLNLTNGSGEYTVTLNYMKGGGDQNDGNLRRGEEITSAKFNIYTVTFESNGQTLYTQSVGANGKVTKPAAPTLDGYTFDRWYSDVALTTEYNFDAPVASNLTLYAKWTQNKYTVRFDKNGGTGSMADVDVPHGAWPLPACTFTAPTGQRFKAWEVDGTEYKVGDQITVTSNITVKAVWENIPANVWTVTLEPGAGTGDPIPHNVDDGEKFTLPICTFTAPTGQQFAGWDIGGTVYKVGETITVTSNITVTAVWEAVTVPAAKWTVTLKAGEGTGTDITSEVEDKKTFTLPICSFTAPTGKQFKAWTDGTQEYAAGYVYTVTANVTFTAVWENIPVDPEPAVTHTVSFNANGGTGSMNPVTVDHGAEYTLPGCGFTAPDGQQFKAWEIDGVVYQPNNIYKVMADTTVIAIWENIPATKWTVTLVPGEGTGTEITAEVEDGKTFTLPECTFTAPTGQRFKAWKIGEQEYAVGAAITVTAHTTVVAIWENIPEIPEPVVEWVVTFYANGGAGEMDPVVVEDGAEYILPECGFTAPEGKKFEAWSINGTKYAVGDTITVTANTDVVAVWEEIPAVEWIVTFDANGGYGTMDPITVTDGGTITLPECGFIAPAGQQFEAWLIDGELYAAGDQYIVTADTTVFAIWGDIPYAPDPQPPVIIPTPTPDKPGTDDPDPDKPGTDDPEPVSPVARFRDIDEDDWFYEAVKFNVENGLMNGTSTFYFEPYGTATRAQIVTILWRLEGEPASSYNMSFKDVAPGEWYTGAVRWAVENGIVNGYSDEIFAPTDIITREQMAAILYRYCLYKGYDVSVSTDISGYADADSVSDWALVALRWACGSGLIQGITESTLVPQGTATRAQIAMILFRFVNGN